MSLLSDFMYATSEAESPQRYFYWAFLAGISAAVGRNAVINRGGIYKTYPNIYVLLVGKSGLRKGVPISIVKTIVEDANLTRVISGRMTTPALIQELSLARSREGGLPPITDARAFLAASEFASFMIDSDEGLTTLTDLYDGNYHKKYTNILKSSGTATLKELNITLLGAINQTHYNDLIQPKDVSGGFIGRTFIILEHKPARRNALVFNTERTVDIPYFVEQFVDINKVCRGEVRWAKDAGELFMDWYDEFSKIDLDDKTGTLERLHEHIIKTAMLIAFSNKRMVITIEDLEEAIVVCSEFSTAANKISINSQAKTSPLSPIIHKIADMVYNARERVIARTMILRKLYPEGVMAGEVDSVLNTLVDSGFLVPKRVENEIFYYMPDEGIEAYEKLWGK